MMGTPRTEAIRGNRTGRRVNGPALGQEQKRDISGADQAHERNHEAGSNHEAEYGHAHQHISKAKGCPHNHSAEDDPKDQSRGRLSGRRKQCLHGSTLLPAHSAELTVLMPRG